MKLYNLVRAPQELSSEKESPIQVILGQVRVCPFFDDPDGSQPLIDQSFIAEKTFVVVGNGHCRGRAVEDVFGRNVQAICL